MEVAGLLLVMASAGAVFFSVLAVAGNNGGAGEERLLSTMISVQGIIYYANSTARSSPAPLQGAVARITCKAVDEYGYEAASYSFLSDSTDANGYFLATLSPSEVEGSVELTECRAFLELSPSESCRSPTNLNNGVSGAVLRSYQFLANKKMKLFSVGPFLFDCQSLD